MKEIKYIISGVVAATMLLIACTKREAALTPSTINELGYNYALDGTNSYDQRIRDYYSRYKSYLLYNFNLKDAYWNILKWDSAYRIIPADPNYVDKQLDLIDSTFFRYYADSTLRNYLPTKFLLCSSIRYNGTTPVDAYLTRVPGSAETGYNYETFIANWGSDRILNIKGVKDSAAIFRGNINYSFLRLLDLKNKTGRSDNFAASADYVTAIINNTQAQRFKRGFLIPASASTTAPAFATDWQSFILAIVQNPYSYLTDVAGVVANSNTYQGILSPVKDSSGLIRKKYDIITDYYKTNYNIDLQRIGNGDK